MSRVLDRLARRYEIEGELDGVQVLTPAQIMQNFEAGVGEKYFMLFNVSHLVSVPEAYVMLEASLSYLGIGKHVYSELAPACQEKMTPSPLVQVDAIMLAISPRFCY